jgi:hypothetical protein
VGNFNINEKKIGLKGKKKHFSTVKYDNLTVFDQKLYSGWFLQKKSTFDPGNGLEGQN